MSHMNRLSLVLFSALLVASILHFLNTVAGLPERVAIHFGTNGAADGWIDRESYRFLFLLVLALLPLLLVWLMAGLPRLTNGKGQIPNCEYWFAQERRQETERFLIAHACWLGCLTVAVVYGAHISIARANAISPPVLASNRFTTMVVVYLCGLVWWTTTYLRHFRRS
jgi:uncharacterized membrane protein